MVPVRALWRIGNHAGSQAIKTLDSMMGKTPEKIPQTAQRTDRAQIA